MNLLFVSLTHCPRLDVATAAACSCATARVPTTRRSHFATGRGLAGPQLAWHARQTPRQRTRADAVRPHTQ